MVRGQKVMVLTRLLVSATFALVIGWERNMPKKLSVFFGAGAEISYGMPSGGQFALDIIRRNSNAERDVFRGLRDRVNSRSVYAYDWLPRSYDQKRISSFGSAEKGSIFKSSLEYNKGNILSVLDDFDGHVRSVLWRYGVVEADLGAVYERETGDKVGSIIFAHDVEINSKLSTGNKKLFESVYFSAALELLRRNPTDAKLEKYLRSVIQIYIGSMGQNLVASLNQEIFSRAPEDISVFDDVSGLFQIEIGQAGLSAYELVIDAPLQNLDISQACNAIFADIIHGVIEGLLASCLDYQSLIDDNFRYLYRPSVEWAKFCKISVFLHSTRSYVMEKYNSAIPKLGTSRGFYDDVAERHVSNQLDLIGIATSNYTDLLQQVLNRHAVKIDVNHLNGHVSDYYDPYKNNIVPLTDTALKTHDRFVVPFLFTQSGIKPLTSVDMSRRYVDYFDRMAASDAVVVAGFGFNGDDGHINGLFRKIIEDVGKPVFVTEYNKNPGAVDKPKSVKDFAKKIRIENARNLFVVPVGDNRMTDKGNLWLDDILSTVP